MILFLDDEPKRMEPWIEELRAAFGEVRVCATATEAMRVVESEALADLRLFVWDLMLPVDEGLDDRETAYGTRTGIVVYDCFRKRFPTVPAILLTNVRDDTLLAQYQDPEKRPHDRAGRKRHILPSDLVQLAKEMGVRTAASDSDACPRD